MSFHVYGQSDIGPFNSAQLHSSQQGSQLNISQALQQPPFFSQQQPSFTLTTLAPSNPTSTSAINSGLTLEKLQFLQNLMSATDTDLRQSANPQYMHLLEELATLRGENAGLCTQVEVLQSMIQQLQKQNIARQDWLDNLSRKDDDGCGPWAEDFKIWWNNTKKVKKAYQVYVDQFEVAKQLQS
ncbi:hypothetical protein K488DRAFT_91220 [Vararia minispora EC-137]|uniref:Uncharacterized protein n=1 Tax=Vararia minispora EC-137 TaxID=1314806 RepID=A0ACB8Q6P3_9AGAM|nr:hypothetical protein K488DRAFT_91220 [Vararia minispora EC-137]